MPSLAPWPCAGVQSSLQDLTACACHSSPHAHAVRAWSGEMTQQCRDTSLTVPPHHLWAGMVSAFPAPGYKMTSPAHAADSTKVPSSLSASSRCWSAAVYLETEAASRQTSSIV